LATLLSIGIFAAFNTLENYRLLDQTRLMKDRDAIVERTHKIRANSPLMAPYGELTEAVVFELNRQNLEEKIVLNDKAMRFWPAHHFVFHQTAFLAWAGHEVEANKLLSQALTIYPKWALLYAKNIRLLSKEDRKALGSIETRMRSVMPEICRIYAPELIGKAPECDGNFD
ncbi:MAG: O-antigen ligase C-terminal domain-containing protein, partial [Betaproteobacteria bacterium]|nr:O-antigen ligase C-terminal domain-containing protein [Betaproteobacteria bacterium]